MKNFIIILSTVFVFSGCVSMQKVTPPPDEPMKIIKQQDEMKIEPEESHPDLENIKDEQLEENAQKKGVIFAKTDFQGLLETRYVKFMFEDQNDTDHKFQLHIGEDTDELTFPWEVKTVKPGYFFVELPAGNYKIASVSIPVGSTTAVEEMDVTLEVLSNTITYVGTLKMVGTKEKIKLGGVPVIKPGFEYVVNILDEREEGLSAFSGNYPNFPNDIVINLMKANQQTNKSD